MGDSAALYEEFQQKLASANASLEAAEVHGVICGAIATNKPLPQNWFSELFDQAEEGDLLAEEGRQMVENLYKTTVSQIEQPGLGVDLLLPTEDAALPMRATAVSLWCQGFIYGVGLAGDIESVLTDLSRESLEDLTAISQMDLVNLGDDEDPEEEEQALMEITEFLWVAAMLIREDVLRQQEKHNAGNSHDYH